MATLVDKKLLGHPAAQSVEIVRVKYDFSKDGGAVGNWEVFEADSPVVVKMRGVHVSTALTSGGSATISAGKGASGTEFLNASAVANFSLGAAVQPASHNAVKLAAGEKIHLAVAVAALTAGVAEVVLEIGAF